jgi:hypothetical protein
MKKTQLTAAAATLVVAVAATFYLARSSQASAPFGAHSGLVYEIEARNARWNHRVMDTPTVYVHGVPAEPVDSLVWDGVGSRKLSDAKLSVRMDPIYNRAEMRMQWTDAYGKWTLVQTGVEPPPHYSGVGIGPSINTVVPSFHDPVVTNRYLHGDTTAGPPVLPTVFALAACWGFAEVTLDGKPFPNPFDQPAQGLWLMHSMLTVGVRNGIDGTVKTMSGGIYDMSQASNGSSDDQDLEFHVVFHDEFGPGMTGNNPPLTEFFYHLVFEDVDVRIRHHD